MSIIQKQILSINDKTKQKMKKNANEFVDIINEKKLDPKYKTEMCKSWVETNFCIYGNKCRFAHGKDELFGKPINNLMKYKQKDCKSFNELGYCMYGSRCNFRHEERKIKNLDRTYYGLLIKSYGIKEVQRLRTFEKLAVDNSENSSTRISSSSSSLSNGSNNNSFQNSTNFQIPFYLENSFNVFPSPKVIVNFPFFQTLMTR